MEFFFYCDNTKTIKLEFALPEIIGYSMRHEIQVKVYYEDTDAGGVMYHASHIRFMERARTEFMDQFETTIAELHHSGIYFVVTHIDIKYKASVKLGETVTVSAEVNRLKGASMVIRQEITRGDELIAEAMVTIASRNKDGIVRLPPFIPEQIKRSGWKPGN